MKKEDMKIRELFDTSHTIAKLLFERKEFPWEILPKIGEYLLSLGELLPDEEYKRMGKSIWIHKSVKMPPTACLSDGLIICKGAQIRHGAFFRGNVIVGEGAVVGNSCELKNSILFDKAQVPHFNYVGDSILGYGAHMGAGAVTSNVKSDQSLVAVHGEDGDIETGLKKFGAVLGDFAEIGCGSVLNPGTIIGSKSNVYPLSSVRGCVDGGCIYKKQGEVAQKHTQE